MNRELLGARSTLEDLIALAESKKATTLKARLIELEAYVIELEAQIALQKSYRQQGGHARARALTHEQRQRIAAKGGNRRQGTTPDDTYSLL